MEKTIIKYDTVEWENDVCNLYYKDELVDTIYADELVQEFMRNNTIIKYIQK